ncbi:MAG TPA: Ig-like domain-containing protein [Terriglobales bacterium]|nr:Ig-like domain-containing protein [Terriglobales bacterium]
MRKSNYLNGRVCAAMLGALLCLPASAAAQNAPQPTITSVSPASITPLSGASDVITITVAPANSGSVTPTGSVSVVVDQTTVNSSLALTGGTASYTFSAASGTHVITARYSGDQNYASSVGTVTLTVAQKTFVISATSVTVAAGSSGVSTITITPLNGYTGTVSFTVTSLSQTQIPCFTAPDTAVSGTAPVTASMTIFTTSSGCPKAAALGGGHSAGTRLAAGFKQSWAPRMAGAWPLRVALLIICLLIIAGKTTRRGLRAVLAMATLALMAGCGSSSSSNIATGTYSLTISGVDKAANVAASTNIVLTVQ